MKLAFPDIRNVIEITDGLVPSLVVESPSLLWRFLQDLQQQLQGKEGRAVLSIDNTPVSIQKSMELLIDFMSFDSDTKRLLPKLLRTLESKAQQGDYLYETHQILAQIEIFLDKLAYEADLELVYEKFSLASLLKAIGIRPALEYNTLEERLFAYMELVNHMDGEKLFVLVNLRCFLPDEAMDALLHTVVAHDIKALLVDGHAYPLLPLEKRLLIDRDLCEL